MIRYGKTTQHAIAAMSRLAQAHAAGERLSSGDIARSRGLSQTLVAKLLSTLSQAGLITGAPGPGGGYALARKPEAITLYDVVAIFERTNDNVTCPFGPNWCGNHEPCPLHDQLVDLNKRMLDFFQSTTFACFEGSQSSPPTNP